MPTAFAPEHRFDLTPVHVDAPFRAHQDRELESLKNRLLNERLREAWDPRLLSPLRGAANDAAALAWNTQFPLLLFPVLFEEKATESLLRMERQESILQRSRELMTV